MGADSPKNQTKMPDVQLVPLAGRWPTPTNIDITTST